MQGLQEITEPTDQKHVHDNSPVEAHENYCQKDKYLQTLQMKLFALHFTHAADTDPSDLRMASK